MSPEYVTYLAGSGLDITLSDEQIKNVGDGANENLLNTLEVAGKINIHE